MIDSKIRNGETKINSCFDEYEDSFCTTFKDEVLPLKSMKSFRATSRDWMGIYQEQGIIENIEKNKIFGPYKGELTNITKDGEPLVSSYHFKKFSEKIENQILNDSSLTIQIGPLKMTHTCRTTSIELFKEFIQNEDNVDFCMNEIVEESLFEREPLRASRKETHVEYQPNPSLKQRRLCEHVLSSEQDSSFVGYNENDVLFGRGGRGNHHPGNKKYRALVRSYKKEYKNTKCKQAKTAMAKLITEKINKDGGRFLRYNKDKGVWLEVPKLRARTKVSQALRETKE